LLDSRAQGQSIKKSSMQHKNNTNIKPTHSNYHYSQQNQSQYYNNSLLSMGTNGLPHQSNSNMQMTKNGQMPFLPRITGASAFSNYTINTGNSTSIIDKVK
jgi:hypothetical protein